MAFFDDRTFLLSHIRHSFITCDDTGMCEMVMLNENIQNPLAGDPDEEFLRGIEIEAKSELLEASQSLDIMSEMELIGAHRRRSNTAQRLERMKKEKKSQAKVKVINWKENTQVLTESELSELFPKKNIDEKQQSPVNEKDNKCVRKSALSLLLEKCPDVPNNPFNEFARFDGRVSEGTPTKRIQIYLTMLSAEERRFPLEVVALCTARVYDLIGLICWQYTLEKKEPKLKSSVTHYSLRIAEENGEVDPDFPSLNPKEPVAKFGFPTLALVEKDDESGKGVLVTIYLDDVFSKIEVPNLQVTMQQVLELTLKKRRPSLERGVNYRLESKLDPGFPVDSKMTLNEMNCLEFILVAQEEQVQQSSSSSAAEKSRSTMPDMFAMEAPLYQSYSVMAVHKIMGRRAEVQMGISGEKLEVTPLPQKNTIKFFTWQPKAATYNVEDIAVCELDQNKSSAGKSTFTIVYHNGSEFKNWTFEADPRTANEICRKMKFVMQMRTSSIRSEYLNMREMQQRSQRRF